MAARWNLLFVLSFCVLLGSSSQVDCNPKCPVGFCCVHEVFPEAYVYCKKLGSRNADCSTKVTASTCPCANGMSCHPNIDTPTFRSLYGKCRPKTTGTVIG
ncbi:uncharacterized protein LOC124138325 [Haliotis rufescens]|uniref:uncharacterized protein LOC124138325 n=1 Tax=Haliotis rufescens TaxID=6454 RepID=UPI00201F4F5A|nr:uncharacterized protein LOC124138325 [Haliotis rufescens]